MNVELKRAGSNILAALVIRKLFFRWNSKTFSLSGWKDLSPQLREFENILTPLRYKAYLWLDVDPRVSQSTCK